MTERKASAFVCDEALFSLSGKITISGMYTQDILIAGNEQQISQLVFFFTIETPISQPFDFIKLRATLPASEPVEVAPAITMPQTLSADPRRRQIIFRLPMLIPMPVLRPGRMVASVIHEGGEMEAGGFWIVSLEEMQKAAAGEAKPYVQG
jgi:hypothetical protein